MNYVVGIPTRGRYDILVRCIEAMGKQTIPPDKIVIVNNNDPDSGLWEKVKDLTLLAQFPNPNIEVISNQFRTHGPEQGHQTALLQFHTWDERVAVRWDDDLIPKEDCLEKIISLVYDEKAAAAGGMYPADGETRTSTMRSSGDGHPTHLQLFEWRGEEKVILEVPHLYSSFAYDVKLGFEVGGFCIVYSPMGLRGETDFTLRMGRAGGCLVDTSAIATHFSKSAGGVPEVLTTDRERNYARHDMTIFELRMRELYLDERFNNFEIRRWNPDPATD